MDKSKESKLYNYIFHYNFHREEWAAIPRGQEKEYFNGMSNRVHTGILFAKEHSTLVDFITN